MSDTETFIISWIVYDITGSKTIPTLFLSVGFFICIISGFGSLFMVRLSATKQIISTESHKY